MSKDKSKAKGSEKVAKAGKPAKAEKAARRHRSSGPVQGPPPEPPAPAPPAASETGDISERVSTNIRALRKARGLSLEALSQASGVSRAALSQIETGKSNPSIGAVWKIATGLGVPFGELLGETGGVVQLLRRTDMAVLRSAEGDFESRPLVRAGALPHVEAYELHLRKGTRHAAEPHAPGTRELVLVLAGRVRIVVGPSSFDLEPGDSLVFSADVPHAYENRGPGEAQIHNVVVYSR